MKTFFVDIDGVIYNKGKINKEVINYIKINNNKLIFCTGRGYLRSLDVIKEFIDEESVIIIENGSKIVDSQGNKIFFKNIFTKEKRIIKSIDRSKIEYIIFNPNSSKNYISFSNKKLKYVDFNYTDYTLFCDELFKHDITQITLKFKNQKYKKEFIFLCQKHDINVTLSEDYVIINAKNISKKSAILFCINKYKIKNNEIVVIGNDYNDIEMFDIESDYKIVVIDENTPELLKEKSTISTSFENLSNIIKTIN